jgi:hypothetical protein
MPTAGNPKRTVRVDDDTWDAYVLACREAGVQPAVALRAFVEFYAHKPGARMPRRPKRD